VSNNGGQIAPDPRSGSGVSCTAPQWQEARLLLAQVARGRSGTGSYVRVTVTESAQLFPMRRVVVVTERTARDNYFYHPRKQGKYTNHLRVIYASNR
jgi:hypothetical protein